MKSLEYKDNGFLFGEEDQLSDEEHKEWIADWSPDITRFVLCHSDQDQAFVTLGGLKVPVGMLAKRHLTTS